jgi:3-oxoacyl-[acyl-carrier protein] reductase
MSLKVAIVTGASGGIGSAIAARLATDGHAVIINYAGNATDATALATTITSSGGQAIAIQADVGDPAGAAHLFDIATSTYGGVDILVNNAGRAVRKSIAEFTDAEFDSVIRTNLYGAFHTMREAARRLRDGGRIINISMSYQGPPIPGYGVYFGSKAAIEQLTAVAARELGARRITVNAVRPGPTRTPLFLAGKSPELIANFEHQIALGRLGEPEDIAKVVSFLAGPEGEWINGQSFAANGGYW